MDCANSAPEEMQCIQVNRVTERERNEFLAPEVTCLWYAENDTSWKGGIVYGQPGSVWLVTKSPRNHLLFVYGACVAVITRGCLGTNKRRATQVMDRVVVAVI